MKKAILHLLTIVVAFNGISGIAAMECDVSASWQTALQAESSVIGFLMAASVPSSIIKKFVLKNFPLCSQYAKQTSPNEPRKNEKEKNTDPLTVILNEESSIRRLMPVTGILPGWLRDGGGDFPYYCIVGRAPAPPAAIIFFLLAYLVILSRVHLPWDTNIMINLSLKPCPSKRTGFHLLRSLL